MPEKPTFIEIFGLIRENLGFLVDLAKDDLCKLQSCERFDWTSEDIFFGENSRLDSTTEAIFMSLSVQLEAVLLVL